MQCRRLSPWQMIRTVPANVPTTHRVLSPSRASSRGSHYIAQTFAKLYHLATLIGGKKHRRSATRLLKRKKGFSLRHTPPRRSFVSTSRSNLVPKSFAFPNSVPPLTPSGRSLIAFLSQSRQLIRTFAIQYWNYILYCSLTIHSITKITEPEDEWPLIILTLAKGKCIPPVRQRICV